jgi:hypothetical protein
MAAAVKNRLANIMCGVALAVLLAACTGTPQSQPIALALPQPAAQGEAQTATLREHQRILAS